MTFKIKIGRFYGGLVNFHVPHTQNFFSKNIFSKFLNFLKNFETEK